MYQHALDMDELTLNLIAADLKSTNTENAKNAMIFAKERKVVS
jgi:hypothetical protein